MLSTNPAPIMQLPELCRTIYANFQIFHPCRKDTFRGREATIIHCNGIIILTAYHINHVSKPIIKAVDNTIYLKPHTQDYYTKVIKQYLNFCGIEYKSNIVSYIIADKTSIRSIIQVVKTCLTILKSEQTNNLTSSLVKKAIRIEEHNNTIYNDEIPF